MLRPLSLMMLVALILLTVRTALAQEFSILYSLAGPPNGAIPYAGLLRDSAGTLYGTTIMGGTGTCYNGIVHGCGTVYKLEPNGNETVLYSFAGGTDGQYPWAALIEDSSGNLYGTTYEGGLHSAGTVFKLDSAGHETILYNFSGVPDGANPLGALIRDAAGNLYGTTNFGGSAACGEGGGCGVIYKVGASGVEEVLHAFNGGTSDGQSPYGSLAHDVSGNLYGTTYAGGTGCLFGNGCGTVYKIDILGHETILYSFQAGVDGSGPQAGLAIDPVGNLYGTTAIGGYNNCPGGCGTVFKIDPSNNETILYRFKGKLDGELPNSSLIRDSSGNLYGTTFGGTEAYGSVFGLSSTGHFGLLHAFTSGSGNPYFASLVRDPAGNLYGTTTSGGGDACSGGCGTIFKVSSH